MSSQTGFDFRWAQPEDEPDIRALVGSVPMPGAVAIRFAREPDYFLGATIMGDPCQVLTIRHRPDGRLAGIACRAEKHAFLNGRESRLVYIGQIRVGPGFAGRWLVHRGAQYFREASPPGLLHFGVIASDNPRARELLVGARPPAGLRAARLCGMTTCALILHRKRAVRIPGLDVSPATQESLGEVVDFLRREGPRRQFFPAYSLADFTQGERLRGLEPQDIMLARRSGELVGVMGAWDQGAYKQDILHAYGPGLKRVRPLYDLLARLVGAKPLTPPGQAMPLSFAACICIADDDSGVMRALLSACMERARSQGKAFLMLGLAEQDPLLPIARQQLHIPYHSDLYALSWSENPEGLLDGRIPYIEIATL